MNADNASNGNPTQDASNGNPIKSKEDDNMTTNSPTPEINELDAGHGRVIHFVPKGVDPTPAIEALTASLDGDRFVAFDVETTGVWASDAFDQMTSMQLGTKTVAVLLHPFDRSHRAAMRDVLNREDVRIVAHNASFDVLRLVRAQVFSNVNAAYKRLDDTLVCARLLMAGDTMIPVDLKNLTAALLGADALSKDAKAELQKLQEKEGHKGVGSQNWSPYAAVQINPEGTYRPGVPLKEGGALAEIVLGDPRSRNMWHTAGTKYRAHRAWIDYCAGDVFDTAALAEVLVPLVEDLYAEKLREEYDIERIVAHMTHRGVVFDQEAAVALLKDKYAKRAEVAAKIKALGVDVVPPKTKVKTTAGEIKEVPREVLVASAIGAEFKKNGSDAKVSQKKTKTGQWKPELDKSSLKKYAAKGSKIAPLFREWKVLDKEIRTYLEPYLKTRATRIHADISTGAARTGRMTCSKPNVQNVPPTLKPLFKADPGMVLISADFSSIEMRVAAAVTGDPVLSGMYTDPLPENATDKDIKSRDPYWLIAWELWGANATKEQRKTAKAVVLGNMYGGGPDTLAENADISVAEASEVLRAYNATFPQLKAWWNEHMKPQVWCGLPHWTLTTGRFQTTDPTRAWAGFNLMIQGTARDLLVQAMIRLDASGFGENMLLPIHDEVLFQVPAAEADDYAKRITDVMASVFQGVPITAEAEVLGHTWEDKDAAQKRREAWESEGKDGHWWDEAFAAENADESEPEAD